MNFWYNVCSGAERYGLKIYFFLYMLHFSVLWFCNAADSVRSLSSFISFLYFSFLNFYQIHLVKTKYILFYISTSWYSKCVQNHKNPPAWFMMERYRDVSLDDCLVKMKALLKTQQHTATEAKCKTLLLLNYVKTWAGLFPKRYLLFVKPCTFLCHKNDYRPSWVLFLPSRTFLTVVRVV